MKNTYDEVLMMIKFKYKRLYALSTASWIISAFYITAILEEPYPFLVIIITSMILANILLSGVSAIQIRRETEKIIEYAESNSNPSLEEFIGGYGEEKFLRRFLPYLSTMIILFIFQLVWLLEPFSGGIKHLFSGMLFLFITMEVFRGTQAQQTNQLYRLALEESISDIETELSKDKLKDGESKNCKRNAKS